MMKNADYIDKEGKSQPYYMGCYGIGITRTLAAIVEKHNDERGIIWPASVAPYQVHLIGLDLEDPKIVKEAEQVYNDLQTAGIEILFDDRPGVQAGAKFADADLIGIPFRVVVSKKTAGKLEVKRRAEKETKFMNIDELLKEVKL